MPRLVLQYAAAIAVAGLAFLVLRLGRGFFFSHAFMVSLAVGALFFTSWRTVERWRG